MDNKNALPDFDYPTELVPMEQGIASKKVQPPKQEPEQFQYPTQLKSMSEAQAVPPPPAPYEGYAGRLESMAGRGAPMAAVNYAMGPFDIYDMAKNAIKSGVDYLLPKKEETEFRASPEETQYSKNMEILKKGAEEYPIPHFGVIGQTPAFSLPTSESVKKAIEPYLYQPKTPEEQQIASQTETGLTYATGVGAKKILPLATRFGVGYGSQAAANTLAEQYPIAAAIPAGVMIGGEGLTSLYRGLRDPDRIMAQKIKAAYDLDVRNGKIDPSKIDPNTPILEAAPEGSALRKLATSESRNATIFPQEIEDFNLRVTDPQKVPMLTREAGDLFQRTIGRPMGQSAELRDLVKTVDGQDVDRLYEVARNYPPAAAIDPTIFGGVENLPIVKKVEQTVQDNIANMPDVSKRAQYEIPDPATGKNGNLAYWDAVYRQLREDGRSLSRDPATASAARNSSSAAEYVRDALDQYTTVGDTSLYGRARNQAHEHFGAVDSLDTGNKFYTKTPSNALQFQDDMAKFSALNPDQKILAKYGYMDSMYQDITKTGFGRMADNLEDETTPFAQKTKLALAKPEIDAAGNPTGRLDFSDYDLIRGKIMKSAVEERLKPVKMAEQPAETSFFQRHPNIATGLAAGAPAAVGAGLNALQDFAIMKGFLSPGILAATAASTAIAAGVRMGASARNAAMKDAANQVLLKLSTGNVRDLQALSKLTRENPFAAAFYRQLNTALRAEQTTGVPAEGQARGGRIARADGGRIDVERGVRALMRAAENAKKSISKTTEPLLDQPDEHIAQALNVAKRHI